MLIDYEIYQCFTQIKGTSTPFTFRFAEVVSGELEGTMKPEGDQNCNVATYIIATAFIAAILTAIIVVCIMIAIWYCVSKSRSNKNGDFYLKQYKPSTKPNGATENNGDVEKTSL